MEPVRIQRSRQHKQASPNGLPIVYVGRPGKFGNPFKLSDYATPEDCIEVYKAWLDNNESLKEQAVLELQGKNLSCFCRPGAPCHADILLKIANAD